jgi:hypothetical protein
LDHGIHLFASKLVVDIFDRYGIRMTCPRLALVVGHPGRPDRTAPLDAVPPTKDRPPGHLEGGATVDMNPQRRVDDGLGDDPAMRRIRGLVGVDDLIAGRQAEMDRAAGVFLAMHPRGELIDIEPDEDEADDYIEDRARQASER